MQRCYFPFCFIKCSSESLLSEISGYKHGTVGTAIGLTSSAQPSHGFSGVTDCEIRTWFFFTHWILTLWFGSPFTFLKVDSLEYNVKYYQKRAKYALCLICA